MEKCFDVEQVPTGRTPHCPGLVDPEGSASDLLHSFKCLFVRESKIVPCARRDDANARAHVSEKFPGARISASVMGRKEDIALEQAPLIGDKGRFTLFFQIARKEKALSGKGDLQHQGMIV